MTTLATRLAQRMTRNEINAWASAFFACATRPTTTEVDRAVTLRNRGLTPEQAWSQINAERFN